MLRWWAVPERVRHDGAPSLNGVAMSWRVRRGWDGCAVVLLPARRGWIHQAGRHQSVAICWRACEDSLALALWWPVGAPGEGEGGGRHLNVETVEEGAAEAAEDAEDGDGDAVGDMRREGEVGDAEQAARCVVGAARAVGLGAALADARHDAVGGCSAREERPPRELRPPPRGELHDEEHAADLHGLGMHGWVGHASAAVAGVLSAFAGAGGPEV